MTRDMFEHEQVETRCEPLAAGAVVLRNFAGPHTTAILAALEHIVAAAPWRHMSTPGGRRMAVAMTNCGECGWVSDAAGYRYDPVDPLRGVRWPALPPPFAALARAAAARAGYDGYAPDACLVNRYDVGTRLSLHQDKDERDFAQPIVSVSLGLPAVFLFGGLRRSDTCLRVPLAHGDVVVWGGAARLRYHGVLPLAQGDHPLLGAQRINLTFRKAY